MRFLSYYCILLFFISCTKEHEKIKEEPIKIYSVEDFDTKLSIIDTACINQTNRAESDIKKGKLVLNNFYLFNTKIHIKSFFDNYEQKKVWKELKKLKIAQDTTLMLISDIRILSDYLYKNYCYQEVMKQAVEKKYGYPLDSLINKIQRDYIISHPDKIYTPDDRDYGFTVSSNKDCEDIVTYNRIRFSKIFKYPNDYLSKKEKSFSYTSATFILLKDGTIKDLKVESDFKNTYNQKFKAYFKAEVEKFVRKSTWLSPKICGHTVNYQMHVTFFHK